MPTISSRSLFHFTRKLEYLIQILEYEFRPRYYPEKLTINSGIENFRAIPMVCFCDIPLSQVKNHIETYGEYGIGLSEAWVFKGKLNPVLYLKTDSTVAKNLIEILNAFQDQAFAKSAKLENAKYGFLKLIRNIKNYKGDFERDGRTFTVKFYDEREWRYTPETSSGIDFWLEKEKYEDPIILAEANAKVGQLKLQFNPEDIKYIIVKNEGEIKAMITALNSMKSKFSLDEVEILTTRILTSEQIKNDF